MSKYEQIQNNRSGFTLVELLIYMGLLAILLVILTEMLVSILNVRLESEATSSVEQDGRFIISRLAYDINRADFITSPVNPGDSSSTLQLNINGESYTYSISGGNLQITDNTGTENLNGSETSVSEASFQRLGNPGGKNNIKINITLESKTTKSSGQELRNFATTLGLK